MPRPAWTLYAYQLIEPDDQLDLFACREVRVHVVARQLELDTPADRTLCVWDWIPARAGSPCCRSASPTKVTTTGW